MKDKFPPLLMMTFVTLALVIITTPILVPNVLATLPGRNGKIVFQRGWPDTQIWVVNADGTGETQLTFIGRNTFPRWSPDGKWIVFVSDRSGNAEIFKMKADGSHQIRLTNNPAYDQEPCWSPDGKKIAFTSNRVYGIAGTGAIFIMNADGSNVKQLTTDGVSYNACSWSPDGTKIAACAECFQNSGQTDNTGYNIRVINIVHGKCGTITQLTNTKGCTTRPCWSPDGTKIVFSSARDSDWTLDGVGCCQPGFRVHIYVMNADGSGQHTPLTYGIESVVDFGPCWSPDGMKIAFERGIDFGGHYICIMDQDGTLTQITDGNGFDRFPDWQPLPR